MAAKKKKSAAKKKVGTKRAAPPKAKKKAAAAPKKKVATTKRVAVKKKLAAKKTAAAAPAKKAPAKKKAAAAAAPRRDATGHLDPKYAKKLRELSREGRETADDRAFFKKSRSKDDLAEEMGEDAVMMMTSGEDTGDRWLDAEVEEEKGGPFVKTRGRQEFGRRPDKSNPKSATREPFPRT